MLGMLYAVLAAAAFGFSNASGRRGVLTGTAIQGMAISVPLGVPLFLIAAYLGGELSEFDRFSPQNIVLLAAAGFMQLVWGRYCNMRSLAAVGSNLSGPVQQFQLLLSLTLAITFLNETLTPLKVIGILLVISAPSIIVQGRKAEQRRAARRRAQASVGAATAGGGAAMAEEAAAPAKPAFQPRLLEGYIFALLSSIGFGTAPILVAAGLQGTGLSLAGGLISYVFATLVVAVLLLVPRNFQQVRTIPRKALPWFTLSALAVWASQLFRYMALAIAPVTVVQPIQSLSLIFRMIFGFFINREHEALDRYVIAAIFLSFAGALALSISAEIVTQYITLPDWLVPLANWRWP